MTQDQQTLAALIIFYSGAIISFILWLWAVIDALKSKFETDIIKLMWVAILFLVPVIGILFYFFIGRKQKIKEDTRKERL